MDMSQLNSKVLFNPIAQNSEINIRLDRKSLRKDEFRMPGSKQLKSANPLKFTFVRDPFVRLVSGYIHKFGRPNESSKKRSNFYAKSQVLASLRSIANE